LKEWVSILPNNLRFFQVSAQMDSDFVDFSMFVDSIQEWISSILQECLFSCLNYYRSSSLKEKFCGNGLLPPYEGKNDKKGSTSNDKKWQSRFSKLQITLKKVEQKQATIKCYVPV
jgi:hypothetical protein